MKRDAVYLKIEQNIKVSNKKVFLEDIAKMFSVDKNIVSDLNKIVVVVFKENKNQTYMFSILKIIELIYKEYPGIEIVNLGEKDFVVEYRIPKQKSQMFEYVKGAFVALTVFFGAMFSIMTFNTDVSVDHVFDNVYKLVLGHPRNDIGVLEIAYSIGLPIGIIVFFNHFSRFKIHDDPTPLQIEMRKYEEDVNKALIQDASRENKTIDAD
jgi:Stage V sporulation protein AA.